MTNSECVMRVALFQGPKKINVETVPRPELDEGEILLRIRACGICGSDLHAYERGMFEEMGIPVENGRVMGHEFAGEVAEIKGEVPGLKIGDRVCTTAIGGNAEY
ncbi:MAG: alcohol dehydrogenase catalytic domain-containing protein, partial [Deltaproteobacteria bacterium]|nr:alcohol dehydrogenase catalytic domain-containing protein [Deltaproteobacteria bacterium]